MSSAQVIRTLLDISNTGIISTMTPQGTPLGTVVTLVSTEEGEPVLRLRANATHTSNLTANNTCSLFVQPTEMPARLLGRVTFLGNVEPVPETDVNTYAARFAAVLGDAVGVDAPEQDDQYMRLAVKECFYVAGLGGEAEADTVDAATVAAAAPDELKDAAPGLVRQWNSDRLSDVLRIAASTMGVGFDDLESAELLWVDSYGMYIKATRYGRYAEVVRAPFMRQISDERDARSLMTMAAQFGWEAEREYVPSAPPALPGLEPED